jgi:hypothetical protein
MKILQAVQVPSKSLPPHRVLSGLTEDAKSGLGEVTLRELRDLVIGVSSLPGITVHDVATDGYEGKGLDFMIESSASCAVNQDRGALSTQMILGLSTLMSNFEKTGGQVDLTIEDNGNYLLVAVKE